MGAKEPMHEPGLGRTLLLLQGVGVVVGVEWWSRIETPRGHPATGAAGMGRDFLGLLWGRRKVLLSRTGSGLGQKRKLRTSMVFTLNQCRSSQGERDLGGPVYSVYGETAYIFLKFVSLSTVSLGIFIINGMCLLSACKWTI